MQLTGLYLAWSMKSEENLLLKSKECQKTQQLKYDTGKKLTPQDTERSLALQ